MKHAQIPDPPLTLRARRAMAFAASLAIAPQVFSMPLWLVLPCLALTFYAAVSPPITLTRLQRGLLYALLLGGVAAIVLYFRRAWGREPGVAILTVMVAAKLLEVKSQRDAMVLWCAAIVLLVAMTTFHQELPALVYLCGSLIVFFALLDVIQDSIDSHPLSAHARQAIKRLIVGVPIALVLFVFFPRVATPLWGFTENKAARTGLSDRMRPGQISELVKSNEVAFRVDFLNQVPPRDALYWRGPVLDSFNLDGDGESWEINSESRIANSSYPGRLTRIAPNQAHTIVQYAITLQPHFQQWIFSLDVPTTYPRGGEFETTARLKGTQQFVSRVPIREAVRYQLSSLPTGRYSAEAQDRFRNLHTGPATTNPRARVWARELLAQHNGDPRAYMRAVLRHIRETEFHYTTQPPLMARNVVDTFWFDERRGFCEHYAGAFTFLMRAAGVPARVVTGYQGGELNPQNDTFVIRQSDAHAWAEVLIDSVWQRVDPTAVIAPSRIEQNLSAALPANERMAFAFDQWMPLHFARNVWDASQHAYTSWLLGYDREQQLRALESFGLSGLQKAQWIGIALLIGVGAVLATIGLYAWREAVARRKHSDVSQRLWLRLQRKLRAAGLDAPRHATPRMIDALVQQHAPGQASAVHAFTNAFELCRYKEISAERAGLKAKYARIAFREIARTVADSRRANTDSIELLSTPRA